MSPPPPPLGGLPSPESPIQSPGALGSPRGVTTIEERRYFKQQEITRPASLPQDAVVPEATRLAATNHYLAPSGSS
ncbi:hypothetical protein H696_04121 [Fonticula alba]|uniref:Uncharacterized protein n=1 Tax=Fonticula alba TaxID=691883 RepID=A0A058Z5Z5_FONAL|nr:hypothetical protein H696_04121 [Fonticula alba]KCV69714.1 hypothetical protein H696_04121 [Fonticula alba]|eukprot:XP_009496279.1 hypothetical protein H696_04121 [Fonticula alba]